MYAVLFYVILFCFRKSCSQARLLMNPTLRVLWMEFQPGDPGKLFMISFRRVKDVYVDLKTDFSGSSIWTLTKSDLPVSNLPLSSTSDIKTGF